MPRPPPDTQQTIVWDLPQRLFHWTLVAAFATAWFTQEESYELHILAGYTVLGLLVFRVVWGFVGSRYARFRAFCYGPRAVRHYLDGLRRGRPPHYLGHNPAGSVMIWLLLGGLLAVSVSGIALDGAENFAGPLKDLRLFRWTGLIETIHEGSSNFLVVLLFAHVAGVVVSSLAHGENLTWSLVTGRKRVHPDAEDR